MTQPYWFTRSFSESKPMKRKEQPLRTIAFSPKHQKDENPQVSKDSTLQVEKITAMTESFLECSRLNQLAHGELVGGGSIKQLICLQHNSPIILYCLSDRRLLCSACTFTTAQHAKHRLQEARTCQHFIQQNVNHCEKVLKLKINELTQQSREWQKLVESMERARTESLDRLDKEHDCLLAILSSNYQKTKQKIDEIFQKQLSNITVVQNTLTKLAGSLRSSHSLAMVNQLFYQEVVPRLNDVTHLMPSRRLGEKIVDSSRQLCKKVLKNYQNIQPTLKL